MPALTHLYPWSSFKTVQRKLNVYCLKPIVPQFWFDVSNIYKKLRAAYNNGLRIPLGISRTSACEMFVSLNILVSIKYYVNV